MSKQTPERFTVTVTAIGERATILRQDGEPTVESFTGTEAQCCAWVAVMHSGFAGRHRGPARTLAIAQAAWSRTGFADEWELSYCATA